MLESELYKSKFWDYRLMPPETATIAFIHRYSIRMPQYNERHGDSKHIDVLRGFDLTNPQAWKNWNTAEKARQWCDERGIPYDCYWRFACEEHERAGWKMRFINSMCGEKMRLLVERRFEKHKEDFIITSNHPFFTAAGYIGSKLQKAYCRDIVLQVYKKYKSKSVEVMKTMVKDGVISEGYFTCQE